WQRPQLFPQRKPLSSEFLGGFWRGLLSDRVGCEVDRRIALHGRQQTVLEYSKLDFPHRRRLPRRKHRRSGMERGDRPLQRELDAKARFHRRHARLCILLAWL